MDEREAREWLLKRRGGLGKRGTDPADWGSDLADDWALEVLAKAAYKRRKTWVLGILSPGVVGPDMSPPHNFSRDAVQEAIDVEGFQLWRLGKTTEA
jgi:hypothetical protein